MSKFKVGLLIFLALSSAMPAFAVDGTVLINQATVNAAGGFPYVITQSGSYKLSGNLVISIPYKDGIDVNADNVTLDLNGFTISGPAICTGTPPSCTEYYEAQIGIRSTSNAIAVRNGVVRGFDAGIFLFGKNNIVEDVLVTENHTYGIDVVHAVVRRNNASRNGAAGISAVNSVVTDNVANSNTGTGISAGSSVVMQNTASFNSTGLAISHGLFGSNVVFGNSNQQVFNSEGLSQGNNGCGTPSSGPLAPC